MWVFGIVAFMMLRPLSDRARASRASSFVVALAGFLPPLAEALVGVALLDLVVDVGLGLAPVNPPAHLGLIALGAATFVAIAHLLRCWLGGLAAAVILVLLLLQLDVLVLAAILVVALALTVWVTSRKRIWTIAKPKPQLQL